MNAAPQGVRQPHARAADVRLPVAASGLPAAIFSFGLAVSLAVAAALAYFGHPRVAGFAVLVAGLDLAARLRWLGRGNEPAA